MVEVTQEDRNAAAAVYRSEGNDYSASVIADGGGDDWPIVQAFARHRQAGVQQGLDMAAGVAKVGWVSADYNIVGIADADVAMRLCEHIEAAIRKLGGGDA